MKPLALDYTFKNPKLKKFAELSLKIYIEAKREEEKKKDEQAKGRKCI
jgi:hypothetical protein